MPTNRKFALRGFANRGFTLLEIIIVLAIASVLVGLSIPFISGMLHEDQMREPVRELQDLARVARNRAMTEHVPYEIDFTPTGFSGRRHILYVSGTSTDTAPPPKIGGTPATTGTAADSTTTDDDADTEVQPDEPIAEFTMSPDTSCQLLFWGSSRWIDVSSADASDQSQWVFQPSGLCNPIQVKFTKGNAWIKVAFNPLTADIQEEHYFFPE